METKNVTVTHNHNDIDMVISADVTVFRDGPMFDPNEYSTEFSITEGWTDVNPTEVSEPISREVLDELESDIPLAEKLLQTYFDEYY